MREKIAESLYGTSWAWSNELKHEKWEDVPPRARTYWYSEANQILNLIVEELDKMELPEPKREFLSYENASKNTAAWAERAVFTEAQLEILEAIKSKLREGISETRKDIA